MGSVAPWSVQECEAATVDTGSTAGHLLIPFFFLNSVRDLSLWDSHAHLQGKVFLLGKFFLDTFSWEGLQYIFWEIPMTIKKKNHNCLLT